MRGKIKTTPVIVNKPPVKTNPKPTTPVIVNKPPVKKPVVANKPHKDTVKIKPVLPPLVKVDSTTKKIKPVVVTPTPPVIRNRTNELVKVLTVNSPDVVVKLYDNGEMESWRYYFRLSGQEISSFRKEANCLSPGA